MSTSTSASPSVDRGATVISHTSEDELLTVHDAARYLNVSPSWVYEHTRDTVDDRLPCVKLGKYLRFDRRDLRAYVDAKRESARTGRRKR